MNKTLEVGDIVTLSLDTSWDLGKDNPIGINGKVYDIEYLVRVKWDNGYENEYRPYDEDLIAVEEE